MQRTLWWLLSGFVLVITGCLGHEEPKDIIATIDPTVTPSVSGRLGSDGPGRPLVMRPTGALTSIGDDLSTPDVIEEEEASSTFILNEILVTPTSEEELAAVLERTGGRVVAHDGLPEMIGNQPVPVELQQPETYVVRVDASTFPLDHFDSDVEGGLNLGGEVRFSSEEAQRLFAMIASEGARGINVGPNFVMEGDANYLNFAEEQPTADGMAFENPFLYSPFRFDDNGSAAAIAPAWAYLAMREVTNRVRVAIIDGGFHLDEESGMPLTTGTGGVSDYAIAAGQITPLQWDTLGDDRTAGGDNPARCSGGNECPWHGNMSVLAAGAVLNNQFGHAGSGGQVVDPIAIKSDLTTGSVKEALRAAAAMNADIVSMSFGGTCDNVFCQFYYSVENYADAFWRAKNRDGMLLLAAAGNDGGSAKNKHPCRFNPSVMCIGALNRDDNEIAGYSNFNHKNPGEDGYLQTVDLWAPAGIPVWTPNDDDEIGLESYFGTSASTPVVAGVAAMLKASDPSLTPTDLQRILEQTAKTDSPSPKVERHLNAVAALQRVWGDEFELDSSEDNNSTSAPDTFNVTSSGRIDLRDRTIHRVGDVDYYLFNTTRWFNANISTFYSRPLTDLDFVFMQVGRSSPPSRSDVQEFTNARIQEFTGLAPGSYLLAVRHRSTIPRIRHRETFYDLFVDFTSAPLPAADQFDRIRSNNTYSDRTRLGRQRGTWAATHHFSTDTDHYEFEVDSPLGRGAMEFTIRNSDYPLILELYNRSGFRERTTNSGSLRLGTGTWTVRVVDPMNRVGRYTFTASGAIPPSDEERAVLDGRPDSFWELLLELGNIDWRVIRGVEYFLVPQGPRPDRFSFEGNVRARLMDLDGNLLDEASMQPGPQGPPVLTLSTSEAPSDQDVLIQVSTTALDTPVFNEAEWSEFSFPEEPFRMFWLPVVE